LILAFALFSCTINKIYYGNYFNKERYWGPMYILKSDSTFEFTHRTNAGTVSVTKETATGTITQTTDSYIFSDSSHGYYIMKGDTIFLNYLTDEIKGAFNGYNIRPRKLFWQGKKLYYFFEGTNQPVRQKQYYMSWSRYKIPNLKRFDENYVPKL
jgi:hypothetical protein